MCFWKTPGFQLPMNKWKTVIQYNLEGQGGNMDLPYDT